MALKKGRNEVNRTMKNLKALKDSRKRVDYGVINLVLARLKPNIWDSI